MSTKRQELMRIAKEIARRSGGKARLAFQEADNKTSFVRDAAHFVKVRGQRVGRDIEIYGYVGDTLLGWEQALPDFMIEVLLPIKAKGLKRSYESAGQLLKDLGRQVYSPEHLKEWESLF